MRPVAFHINILCKAIKIYGWRTSWRSRKWKHWNMAKALRPRYCSRWKTAGEDQQSVTSCSCQESVEVVENLQPWFHSFKPGMFQCQNESCPPQKTNLAFPMTEKSRAVIAMHRASVLGFWAIGGSQATAKRFQFFWSVYVERQFWMWCDNASVNWNNGSPSPGT